MNEHRQGSAPPGGLNPEIEATLFALRPEMPRGFAQRARERFEAIHARRRIRRWALLTLGLFTGASALTWAILLNVGQVGATVWSGIWGAVAVIRTLFTIWDHIPGFGVLFAMVSMMVVLVLGGMVSKLDSRAFSLK